MVRTAQAQAQAQAQKQAEITATESLNLVRGLLRVVRAANQVLLMQMTRSILPPYIVDMPNVQSIFHVSFLRGLFPESAYRNVEMSNLEGMNIKVLTPACNESKRLIEWVEQGVQDALEKGYLKTLFFGISTDAEGTSLLEEYIFNFRHDKEGGLSLDLAGKNGKEFSSKAVQAQGAVSNLRFQVVRLMRMLVQICQTLDFVPSERYLFMKMTYHPNTPEEYEPPGFCGIDEEKLGYFSRKPFSMDVGTVATPYHGVVLRVKSMLDSCDFGGDGTPEPEASMQNSTMRRAASHATGPCMDGSESGDEQEFAQPDACTDIDEDETMKDVEAREELVSAVVAFCQRRVTVEAADILSEFLELPQALLDASILPTLLERAVLERTDQQDTYRVVGPTSKAKAAKMEVTTATKRLQRLAVADKAAAVAHAAASEQGKGSSLLGRVQTSDAGTDATYSAAADGSCTAMDMVAPPAKQALPMSQLPELVFFESQQSLLDGGDLTGKRRIRKASYVEAPIYQAAKKARADGASTRASPCAAGPSVATSRRNAPRGKAR